MSGDTGEFGEVEQSKSSVTKNSLTFLLEGIDPRDLAADGLSIISYADSEWSACGVREAPTCQELAIEGECLTKQGNHKEAIPLLESALEMGTDDVQLLSVLWSLLGNAHFYLGDYEKASICHQHDLAICNELGDKRNQAQAYCNLGIANRKTGYLERAKLCYERYLEISERIEDARSMSKAHHNLGDLHLTLARLKLQRDKKLKDSSETQEHLEKATDYFKKHLEYVKETNNRSAEARAHASLGYVYELMQDVDKAIDHYELRLKIAVEISDKGAEGRSYCSIGNCLRAMVQPDKSLECYKRGLSIARELEDEMGEAIVSGNIGMAHEMLCNLDSSQEHYKQQLDSMKSQENAYGEAMALDNLARTYEYMANVTKAYESLESLLVLRKKLKQEEDVADVTSRLNKLNEIRGGTPKHFASGSSTGTRRVLGTGTGAGGGGASAGIWKKLKGKKKKQRNLTAPEITTQEVAAAASQRNTSNNLSITPLKEHEDGKSEMDLDKKDVGKDTGKGKGIFGRKQAKEKSSPDTKKKRKSRDITGTAKKSEVVLRNDLVMTPSDSDDIILSQRSDHSLSQTSTTQEDLTASPASKRAENTIMLEVLDLSQSSGKHPSSSALSSHALFASNEEQFSTQSSSEVAISISLATETETPHTQEDSRSLTWGGATRGGRGEEEEEHMDYNDFHAYLQGCAALYKEFGSKQHKLSLKKVQEFLESSEEMEPVDLKLLQDWDGWIVAVKEIVIPSTSKESKLI